MKNNVLFPGQAQSLVDLLSYQASQYGDKLCYIFIDDGGHEKSKISFRELDQRAKNIGSHLTKEGIQGKHILYLMPPGIDFVSGFLGCLYAGNVVVPSYPPTSKRNINRLQSVVKSSGVEAIVCDQQLYNRLLNSEFEAMVQLSSDHWYILENLEKSAADDFFPACLGLDDLCFVQFTSGSTLAPKGVMLSHGNLLHNLDCIHQGFGLSDDRDVHAVSWLPPYHDMGLIGNILGSLYSGITLVMMSPMSFIKRPIRWLQAISDYQATVSGAPNFAYELCVEKIRDEQLKTLDLSSWQLAFSGAEPIRSMTFERFYERFKAVGFNHCAFYPCYGLAESALLVTGGQRGQGFVECYIDKNAFKKHQIVCLDDKHPDATQTISCGRVFDLHQIRIVNPDTKQICSKNEVGEIWVSGPSVAKGYINNPDATVDVFNVQLAEDNGHYMRTGDLGFLQEDQLYISGRNKDLIILQGSNHYPQDIEYTACQAHPSLVSDGAAAFSLDDKNHETLILIQEVEKQTKETEYPNIIVQIRSVVLRYHEIEPQHILLIRAKGLPKTTSGKVQRSLCKKMYIQDELNVLFTETEAQVATVESQQLAVIREELEAVSADDVEQLKKALDIIMPQITKQPFNIDFHGAVLLSDLGLSSLQQVEMIVKLEEYFAIQLDSDAMINVESMADLAGFIEMQWVHENQECADQSEVTADSDKIEAVSRQRFYDQWIETMSWKNMYLQFMVYQFITDSLYDKPSRIIKTMMAMKPYLDIMPAERLKLAKKHIWFEQFNNAFLHTPKQQQKIRRPEKYFPLTLYKLNQFIQNVPKPSILMLFHMAGWQMLLSMLVKAIMEGGQFKISLLGDASRGHFESLKSQAEMYYGQSWKQFNHNHQVRFIDINDPKLHFHLISNFLNNRLLVVFPDTVLAQQGKGEPVNVPLLNQSITVASGIFKIAAMKQIPIIPVVHGFNRSGFYLHFKDVIETQSMFEDDIAQQVASVIAPQVLNLEQNAAIWSQWEGIKIEMPDSNAQRISSDRLINAEHCVWFKYGQTALILNISTFKIVQVPMIVFKYIKKCRNKQQLHDLLKSNNIQYPHLDQTISLITEAIIR